jgi:L-alanine-DL-glutamate epimerase-like enolase superfamily enzyme
MSRPRASLDDAAAGRLNHVVVLLVQLATDAGVRGLGFAYALQTTGRGFYAVAVDDIAPLLTGEDPLDHERLAAKVYWSLQGIGRRGLVAQAYSAFDVAMWDLKGKAASLPLYKLLGGARESTPAYGADTAWRWMSPDQIVEASRPYLGQGLMGVKVHLGGNPQEDADRLTRIREGLGDDAWLAVDAHQRYDYATALAIGHFFEEEVSCDWFEEPISCEDVDGSARLATKLEIPIAGGESLFGRDEFERYLDRGALGVVQPDVTRLGGITPWLKVAAMAEARRRPVSPHLLPEIGVHMACGLPGVASVEYMPWLAPLFTEPERFENGRLVPPTGPGLGLELNREAAAKYGVNW